MAEVNYIGGAKPGILVPQSKKKPEAIILDILDKLRPTSIEKSINELVQIGERNAYSENANVVKASDYIISSLREQGYKETADQKNRGVFVQKFIIQSYTSKLDKKPAYSISEPSISEKSVEKQTFSGKTRVLDTLSKIDISSLPLSSPFNFVFNDLKVENSNVVLTIPGVKTPGTTILLCAHYDSVGGPGAGDNASGVAALLETARLFSGHKFEYTIKIVFFSAEEQGCLGSRYYLSRMPEQEQKSIAAVIVADMLGRKDDDSLDIMFDKKHPETSADLISQVNASIRVFVPDLKVGVSPDSGCDSDDDVFQWKGIPTVFVSESSDDEYNSMPRVLHTVNDTIDHIDTKVMLPNQIKAIISSVAQLAKPID